jgi:hypothetical protein
VGSGDAVAMAAYTAVGMLREVLRGNWGVDVLAVTAILSTVAVGEYLASLVVAASSHPGQGAVWRWQAIRQSSSRIHGSR